MELTQTDPSVNAFLNMHVTKVANKSLHIVRKHFSPDFKFHVNEVKHTGNKLIYFVKTYHLLVFRQDYCDQHTAKAIEISDLEHDKDDKEN